MDGMKQAQAFPFWAMEKRRRKQMGPGNRTNAALLPSSRSSRAHGPTCCPTSSGTGARSREGRPPGPAKQAMSPGATPPMGMHPLIVGVSVMFRL